MTAGTGILHSEVNPSGAEQVHLLQIWILPERPGLTPGYDQRLCPEEECRGRLRLLVSGSGRDGSVRIHQDADLYGALLAPGEAVEHAPAPGRGAWLQVARGEVLLNGERLHQGDGAAADGEEALRIEAVAPAEILLFDLA